MVDIARTIDIIRLMAFKSFSLINSKILNKQKAAMTFGHLTGIGQMALLNNCSDVEVKNFSPAW